MKTEIARAAVVSNIRFQSLQENLEYLVENAMALTEL
jgi:hypothetical protein